MRDEAQLAFFPGRIIFMILTLLIAQGIEQDMLRYGFIFLLAIISGRMFPIIDRLPSKEKK